MMDESMQDNTKLLPTYNAAADILCGMSKLQVEEDRVNAI